MTTTITPAEAARRRLGLRSQDDAGALIGVSPATVYRAERHDAKPTPYTTAIVLAALLAEATGADAEGVRRMVEEFSDDLRALPPA